MIYLLNSAIWQQIQDISGTFFDKYSSKAGKQINFKDVYLGWPLYMDDYTQIVDLTVLRGVQKQLRQTRQ